MKTVTLLFSLLLLFTFSQTTRAQYTYTFGGASFDMGTGVGVDGAGNAYFIGEFRGTFDFDPGTGTASLSSTQGDIYVVSYEASGNFRFVFPIANAFPVSEAAGGIAVDNEGTFYVTGGQPFGTIDFDPDPTTTADRTGELFIAGYDNTGAFLFARAPAGTDAAASGKGEAIALDGAGNLYATGRFVDTIDFNPGGTPASLTSAGSSDLFVASYTTGGTYRFAFALGGVEADQGLGIAVDGPGNVYVTGSFGGTVSFDPADTDSNGDTEDRTATGITDLFLASYTAAGDFRFVYTLGGTDAAGNDVGYGLATDAADNLYLTGRFTGTVAFDPDDTDGNSDTEERAAEGNGSAFVASYTSAGVFRFVSVPTGGFSVGRGLVVDASGNSSITGSFGGTVDFDPGADTASFSSGEGTDVFVAGYGTTGAYRGAFTFGGTGLNTGIGLAVDAVGNVLLTGEFTGTTDFDPGEDTDERTGAGQNDAFLAKYLSQVVLPVELTSFRASGEGRAVLLRWETATETNNAGFEIQMGNGEWGMEMDLSENPQSPIPNPQWTTVGWIEGHGTTAEPQHYEYRLENLAPGPHRFRLKQIDFDGAFAYSPEVEVTIGLPGAFLLTPSYPNPSNGQARFTLSVQQTQHVQVAVHNLLGQRVGLLHDGVLQSGKTYNYSFDAGRLSDGVYLIRVVGEQFRVEEKAVVLR